MRGAALVLPESLGSAFAIGASCEAITIATVRAKAFSNDLGVNRGNSRRDNRDITAARNERRVNAIRLRWYFIISRVFS